MNAELDEINGPDMEPRHVGTAIVLVVMMILTCAFLVTAAREEDKKWISEERDDRILELQTEVQRIHNALEMINSRVVQIGGPYPDIRLEECGQ